MKKRVLFRGAALLALVLSLAGCGSGPSGDGERLYGTAVDPGVFFTPPDTTRSKEVELAECMTANGAIVYGSRGCSITRKQLALFADGAPYLNYVDCNDHREECSKNRIEYYPTWICNGKRLEGSYYLDLLADFAGCE